MGNLIWAVIGVIGILVLISSISHGPNRAKDRCEIYSLSPEQCRRISYEIIEQEEKNIRDLENSVTGSTTADELDDVEREVEISRGVIREMEAKIKNHPDKE